MKRALRFLVLFAFCSGALPAGAQQRSVSAPQVVSEKRINRTIFEYVMQASLTNGGSAMARNVVATVTSTSPRTTIVQNTLHFGDVPANLTSPSQDTFTIRHDRTVPFDAAVLQWTITAAPTDPVLSAPPSPTMLGTTSVAGMTDPNVTIEIIGGASTVTGTSDASGAFMINVPLQANKLNILFVAVIGADGQRSAFVPVAVLQDSQPPSLFIDFPAANGELTNDSVVVSGRVGDMLSGYQGLTVNVAGQPATVNVGIGNNGTFERSVPLVLGTNTIGVTATDINGNTVTKQVAFKRITPVGPRMLQVSGDMQSAQMHGRLPQPIVVKIVNADGTPFAGKLATFTVTLSDGRLVADHGATAPGVMVLQVPTDANGLAKAWWNVGADAGRANNRVAVTSKDIAGTAFFCASADPGPAHQINIGTGNNQRGEAGAPTAEPLRAWVNDMCNGIANLPVTFTVKQGGGKVNGQDSVTINTSITGHAQVAFTLGPNAGNNVVEANYPNNPNLPATFIATGVVRDFTKPTTFSGLVLDNTSQPVGGALCQLTVEGITFTTMTDVQGRFVFEPSTLNPQRSILPSGPARLFVDGTPATLLGGQTIPQGSYPFLMYHQVVVANAENSLPTPVLLPRLNPNNAKTYDGTKDVVLTCEGIAGLQMVIKAGSMRRADGTIPTPQNPQVLSLNQVHADNVPMPIPDGASPPFTWTLQPAMATFDPPVQIQYPNMSGLPSGAVAYFLSFNHDTEKFEIIATGHVAPDASIITTDPGAGISVAGWGCNCPPYSATADCERCKYECYTEGVIRGSVSADPLITCEDKNITFEATASQIGGQILKHCPKSGDIKEQGNASLTFKWQITFQSDTSSIGVVIAEGVGPTARVANAIPGAYAASFTVSSADAPAAPVDCKPPERVLPSNSVRVFPAARCNDKPKLSWQTKIDVRSLNRDRTSIGVGEEVQLIVFPETAAGVNWLPPAYSGGGGTLSGNDNSRTFVAGSTKGSATIHVTNADGLDDTVTFTIYEPVSETAVNNGDLTKADGWDPSPADAGAAMYVKFTVAPTEVSFYNVQIIEGIGSLVDVSGWFDGDTDLHSPDPNWRILSPENNWYDKAQFGPITPEVARNRDLLRGKLIGPHFYYGTRTWVIPVKWRVLGTNGDGKDLNPSHQTFIIRDETGTSEVKKEGASSVRIVTQ